MTYEEKLSKFTKIASNAILERKKAYNVKKSVNDIAKIIFDKYNGTGTKITDIKELFGCGEYFYHIVSK